MTTILCEGASNTRGAVNPGEAWPEQLGALGGWTILNCGRNSQTITDCRRVVLPEAPHFRTPTLLTALPDHLTGDLDAVILSPCNMDAHLATTYPGQITLRPAHVVFMLRAYTAIVQNFPRHDGRLIDVFLCTSPRIPKQMDTPAETFVCEQNALIRDTWHSRRVIDVESLTDPTLYWEGAHLNPSGHRAWAERAFAALSGVL